MSPVSFDERARAAAASLRRVVEQAPPITLPSPVGPRRAWWPFVVLGVAAAIAALVTAVNADDGSQAPAPAPTTTSMATTTSAATTTTTTTTVARGPATAVLTLRGPGLPDGIPEVVRDAPIEPTGSFRFAPVPLSLEGDYDITVTTPRGTATRTVPVVAGESITERAPPAPTKTEPVTLSVAVTVEGNRSPITLEGRTLVDEPQPPSAGTEGTPAPPPDEMSPSEEVSPSDDGLSTGEVAWGVVLFVGLALFGLGGGLVLSARSPLCQAGSNSTGSASGPRNA
ncbi:MAG: hypothetical protein ACT4PI_12645 [Actinomycetota bacterium]